MIELDGNYLEGGGQIVRTALALSALTSMPFHVSSIRKNRPNPGLKHQHLHAVKILGEWCDAEVSGCNLGSTELRFMPRGFSPRDTDTDVGTAGSITLVLQAILLPGLFADREVRIRIRGGTDTKWAMPFDYFANVLLPHIRRFAGIRVNLLRRGYYPKGGGLVEIIIEPKTRINSFGSLEGFISALCSVTDKIEINEKGNLSQIKGISHASGFLRKSRVAERQAGSAKAHLSKTGCPVEIKEEYCDTDSPGSGITLWAEFSGKGKNVPAVLGADALGERGLPAEIVGRDAAEKLLSEIKADATMDSHLADQILPFMALLGSGSFITSNITDHCRTNMYAVERFLAVRFVTENNRVVCRPKA